MKKIIAVLSLLFMGFCGYSQELKPEMVPQKILDRFHHTFPQSVDLPVSWVKEKGDYKATLTIMESPAIMVIDSLGKTKRIERKINEIYLPKNAKDYLKNLDSNYQVITVTKIVDEKDKVTYNTTAKIKTNFTFDDKGKISNPK
ncbi:MAG: hypothetical protein NT004_02550 [Bacteroidetes bacterium]|nr:hypothetical protein [Bacteroidota bacterium]